MQKPIADGKAGVETANAAEKQQLVALLAALPAILRSLEVDPAEVLKTAGLGAGALENPESFVPQDKAVNLLNIAAETAACPHLGLLLGARLSSAALGVIGEAMRSAPTLRAALLAFAANQHFYAPGCVSYLTEEKDNGRVFFGVAGYQPGAPGDSPVLGDCLAMAAVTLIRELGGDSPDPVTEVYLSRIEPPDPALYREAFAVGAHFNAGQTAAMLVPGRLDQPLAGADAALHTSSLARSRALGHAGDGNVVDRLRRLLRVALIGSKVSANEISDQLGVSRRTLHRRLDAAGVHYQEILDQTRHAFAQQLLANTTLRIGEIAIMVGYTDPSALTRRFIHWTGVPPNEWRSSLKKPSP